MKLKNVETRHNLVSRLRRIEGQVRGVENMINEERDCEEILQQLTAIRSAVQSASQLFLEEYATDCLVNLDSEEVEEREKIVREILHLLGKAA